MSSFDITDPGKIPDGSLTNGRSRLTADSATGTSGEFRLGDWMVRPQQNRILRAGREIMLEPKAMDVLVKLAAARGETVGRDELLDSIWPGVFVGDDSLHRAVSRLRRALSVDAALKDAVVTVPKRGYRLDGRLLRAEGEAPPPPEAKKQLLRRGPALLALGAVSVLLLGAAALTIRVSEPDQSDLRSTSFTGYAGRERAPDFSPDGERVVFAWSGESGADWDLYIKRIGEWSPKPLTRTPHKEYNPAWSPDGKTIAFVRLDSAGACRIMTIEPDGSKERELIPCKAGGDVDLDWSPNSKALYFTDRVGADGPIAVHRFDLATGAEKQVTYPPADYWGDGLVRASPDGREIAFARTRALGVTDVFTAPAGGGAARQVTDDRLKVHGLSWSSDGETLFFSSNRGGAFGLWRVRKSGPKPQPVAAGGVNADSVVISNDGRRLLFETERTSSQIKAVTMNGSEAAPPKALGRASGWDWHPAIAPDGRHIAFISDRSGSPELWVSDVEGNAPKKLTSFGGPYANAPAWSPDGTKILVASPVDGNFDIYAVDAVSGELDRLTDHPAADYSPTWSADGRSIYFGSNRTGRWEIWRLTLDGRRTRQLTRQGGFRAIESPAGRLLFVKREAPGLFSLDLDDEAPSERLISERLLPLDWSNWSVADGAAFFIARGGDGASLERLDLATSRIETIRSFADFPYDSGLAMSPDGSFAVFADVEIVEADLVLMEGFAGGG